MRLPQRKPNTRHFVKPRRSPGYWVERPARPGSMEMNQDIWEAKIARDRAAKSKQAAARQAAAVRRKERQEQRNAAARAERAAARQERTAARAERQERAELAHFAATADRKDRRENPPVSPAARAWMKAEYQRGMGIPRIAAALKAAGWPISRAWTKRELAADGGRGKGRPAGGVPAAFLGPCPGPA